MKLIFIHGAPSIGKLTIAQELEKLKVYSNENNIQIEVGTKRLDERNLNVYLEIARFFHSPFLRIIIDDIGYQPDIPTIISLPIV